MGGVGAVTPAQAEEGANKNRRFKKRNTKIFMRIIGMILEGIGFVLLLPVLIPIVVVFFIVAGALWIKERIDDLVL